MYGPSTAILQIVAVMRGPRPPAPACNYSVKLYYCQEAGAVGVIFVDWDPVGRFTVMPRLENGPIYPNGPSLTVRIPSMLTLHTYASALQVPQKSPNNSKRAPRTRACCRCRKRAWVRAKEPHKRALLIYIVYWN